MTTPNNPFAFPFVANDLVNPGLSLRDYFAAHIAAGMVTDKEQWGANPETMAANAYQLADAMLKERERK